MSSEIDPITHFVSFRIKYIAFWSAKGECLESSVQILCLMSEQYRY